MTLKSEFQKQLEAGADDSGLVALVRRFKADGLSQREAYDQLHALWLEYGFDDDDTDESPLRDNLEYVMEIVWGFCPAGRAIWDGSLSNESQPSSHA
jgi:hypothetical protein